MQPVFIFSKLFNSASGMPQNTHKTPSKPLQTTSEIITGGQKTFIFEHQNERHTATSGGRPLFFSPE
jgi:hypothetical protein